MRFLNQTADRSRPQPSWLRALALFCVVLVGTITTAQAAHIHGQWLPHGAPEVSKHLTDAPSQAEDACPLCMAMHAALPAPVVSLPQPVPGEALLLPLARVRGKAATLWRYDLFSRPPPTLLL